MNKKLKKIVLQGIDSPRRDLEWRLLIANLLCNEGISSVIGSLRDLHHMHEHSRNCVWFGRLPSNTGRTEFDRKMLMTMQRNNTSLFFLHDEGAFYLNGEYESAVNRVYPVQVFNLPICKKVFVWGKRQWEYLKTRSPVEKLVISGAPRFDLLSECYAKLDDENVKDLQEKYGDYILISGRFAAVNMVPDDPGFLSKRMYDIHIEGDALEFSTKSKILKKMFSDWSKTTIEFSRFVDMVANLALDFPEVNFVFRPHPSEKMSTYSEAFQHFSNVFVDKSYDVRPFIRASKGLIHCECTTGLEAVIANKPSINYRPCKTYNEFSGSEVAGLDRVGFVVTQYSEVKNLVKELAEHNSVSIVDDMYIPDEYLHNSAFGKSAANVIIEELKKHFKNIPKDSEIALGLLQNKLNFSSFIHNIRYFSYKMKRKLIKANHEGDTKLLEYPNKRIIELWIRMGGKEEQIKIVNGVIYTLF